MLADGGEAIADLAVLRDQAGVFGSVASTPTAWRLLRHTGNTLAADASTKLKDLMVRAGQSSERAQLIYQHSTKEHQQRLAADIDLDVRRRQSGSVSGTGGGATVHPLVPRRPSSAPRAARR